MINNIEHDGEQLLFKLQGSTTQEDAYTYLKEVGCIKPDILECEGSSILLQSNNDAWRDRFVPFSTSKDELWNRLRSQKKKPEHFYLIGDDNHENFKKRVEFFFSWKSVLEDLSYHEGGKESSHKFIYFLSKDSQLKKFEISYFLSCKELESILFSDEDMESISRLESSLLDKADVHAIERQHVMREALLEMLSGAEVISIKELMGRTAEFSKNYDSRYKIYVSKFSVNKTISEIESERINYLSKIQDSIMSQQGKAFAIPGVMIAIGALLRFAGNAWDFILVALGMLISTWMVTAQNKSTQKYLDFLWAQIKHSFKKYDDIIIGLEEIKTAINESDSLLKKSIKNAKKSLDALTTVSWAIFAVVCVIISIRSNLFDALPSMLTSVFLYLCELASH